MIKNTSNKLVFLTLIFLFSFLGTETIVAQSEKSGLSELWQELYVYRDFNEKISGEVLFNNLYDVNLGNYDWFIEGKISYHWKPWLDIEAMYRHEYFKLGSAWLKEYRPMIRFSAKTNIGNWSIRNRHRFELRMFEFGDTRFRFRSDLKINPNFNWTAFKINPYVQEEIFIGKDGFNRNRIYSGFEGKKGRFEPAIYFLLQSDDILSDWNNRIIFGFVMGVIL
jgi:hypothetical protein